MGGGRLRCLGSTKKLCNILVQGWSSNLLTWACSVNHYWIKGGFAISARKNALVPEKPVNYAEASRDNWHAVVTKTVKKFWCFPFPASLLNLPVILAPYLKFFFASFFQFLLLLCFLFKVQNQRDTFPNDPAGLSFSLIPVVQKDQKNFLLHAQTRVYFRKLQRLRVQLR